MEPEEGLALRSHVKYSPPSDANTNLARELLEAFKRHGSRTLLVDTRTGRHWSAASLLDHCGRLASGLIKQVRLEPNEVVMTICDHSDAEIAMALAVMLAGGALYGTTPGDGYEEVKTLCSIVKPDVFIVSRAYHERASALRKHVAPGARIVWLDGPEASGQAAQTNGRRSHSGGPSAAANGQSNGVEPIARTNLTNRPERSESHGGRKSKAAKQAQAQVGAHDEHDERDDQLFLVDELLAAPADWPLVEATVYERIDARKHILTYMLTSGSTGRPKVVPSTHEQLVHGMQSMICACRNELELPASRDANANLEGARTLAPLLPLGPDDVVAGDLPLDHGAGFNTLLLALLFGCKIIVMPSYDVDAFWQAVSDHRVSFSVSSTTFGYKLFSRLKALVDAGEAQRWRLDSFRYIACCGAKLAFTDLVREVQRHYAHMRVTQAYGCTEIGFISMVHADESHSHLHSAGFLFPGLQARLVPRDQRAQAICPPLPEAGASQRGELLVWARSKFQGYRCEPAGEPQRHFADCHDQRGLFYRTGDQAHLDAAGRLYIHGRFKDTLVLMEDWKILPVELEDVIAEHPLVESSVVVGVPDPQLPGCHAPKAFVKLVGRESAEARRLARAEPELVRRLEAADWQWLAGHIYEFVAARTARPKHLTGGVRILAEFPRVGLLNKVDRKQLKLMD